MKMSQSKYKLNKDNNQYKNYAIYGSIVLVLISMTNVLYMLGPDSATSSLIGKVILNILLIVMIVLVIYSIYLYLFKGISPKGTLG